MDSCTCSRWYKFMNLCQNESVYEWNPKALISTSRTDVKYAILILNRPILGVKEAVISLWNRAYLRVTVDGGTNCWYKFSQDEGCVLPDFITGDFDSVEESILSHYRNLGVNIVCTPDQNYTDFTKAVLHIVEYVKKSDGKIDGIIALGECNGRLDQILANINTLYNMKELLEIPIYLLTADSLTWVLKPGRHVISIASDLIANSSWCCLVPVGQKATSVTTTGLKWNLNNSCMEFGGLISTSNTYNGEPEVTIKTDTLLLWSMGLGCKDEEFSGFEDDLKTKIANDMTVTDDFLTPEEEKLLFEEVEPYMKRLRYEFDHWDDAIHGYRETERLKWTQKNMQILNRARSCAFPPDSSQLSLVHVLDLSEKGVIKPHIDSVRFCGNTIAGLSLLSDSVMRLVHHERKENVVDVLLKRRSMYIMKDCARYDFTHEILGPDCSNFNGMDVPRQRRLSIICRNGPVEQ